MGQRIITIIVMVIITEMRDEKGYRYGANHTKDEAPREVRSVKVVTVGGSSQCLEKGGYAISVADMGGVVTTGPPGYHYI